VHFGLGKATNVDLEVHWPSGQIDKISGVKANRVVTVVEGKPIG
jgi:enediyne biosynthesis protein E4